MSSIDDERIHLPTSESNHIDHIMAYMYAIPLVKGKVVADLCCGTGYGTRLLSEAAERVSGFDYSLDALDYCESRKLPNTKYFLANVEDIDKFDTPEVITCMQGLEHLDDPKALIQKHLDKEWIFALPYDRDDTNPHHHHKITPETIKDWFGESVTIRYFIDGQWVGPNDYYTNFWGYYKP